MPPARPFTDSDPPTSRLLPLTEFVSISVSKAVLTIFCQIQLHPHVKVPPDSILCDPGQIMQCLYDLGPFRHSPQCDRTRYPPLPPFILFAVWRIGSQPRGPPPLARAWCCSAVAPFQSRATALQHQALTWPFPQHHRSNVRRLWDGMGKLSTESEEAK